MIHNPENWIDPTVDVSLALLIHHIHGPMAPLLRMSQVRVIRDYATGIKPLRALDSFFR
jgi:hypothetical protein